MSSVQTTQTAASVAQTDSQGQAQAKKTPLELNCQGTPLPGIPKHPTFAAQRQWLLEQMALAFRCFARKGYTDGMAGHISVRDPENPHTFWTNPLAVHFGLLKASDMILVDYNGVPVGGNMSRPANAAGFLIHSAVHKARPDVTVAAHMHSPHGMAWSAFGRPVEMLTQDAAYLYGDAQAVYKDFGGVVLNEEEGRRVAAALGPRGKAMIMQNHGLLTVGSTVEEACFLMTLLERACQVQLLAEAAAANGVPKILIAEESARYTFDNSSDAKTLYWEGQPDLQYEEYMAKGEHKG
ncbi:class II aldolase/adducin N-terminal [Emericellopsis atlantica]|uniref:Class II aldolase/adducin N-terminal n=1 Tax=Emericellopsis atlantica TaxID=2614577 RepID=A0A9P8CLD3_9HYPO|nr:class II aldolase/adducin N-terminal [Emericellopsis atlantica]KAG9251504.1 class II aldolase/adducin N-terminal [Emericellopsis atlantica]